MSEDNVSYFHVMARVRVLPSKRDVQYPWYIVQEHKTPFAFNAAERRGKGQRALALGANAIPGPDTC